jgi:preprotein translocase subunit SecA
MSSLVLRGRIPAGFYPENRAPEESPVDRWADAVRGRLWRLRRPRLSRFKTIVAEVGRLGGSLSALDDREIEWRIGELRGDLRARGFDAGSVARTFALVREVAARRLGMRHFDVQILGGYVLLQGMVAEMNAGEGKTLTATLPACAMGLAGIPVHIITVNDYLAKRDSEWMKPVYSAFGLSVGCVVQGAGLDERRDAYRCDVTYCTNKEIVFDYLRDRLEIGRKPGEIQARLERLYGGRGRLRGVRLRGLCFGIVDEADSVLIDEARTPLIIAGQGENTYESAVYGQALEVSAGLQQGTDYTVDFGRRTVDLTDAGRDRLGEAGRIHGGFWTGRLRREEIIRKALTARLLFHRNRHYVIRGGKIEIVDEYTGRVMQSRSWEGGLHQLIEVKEGCPVTSQNETLGRISYQRFFRRYLALAGMTGTAREARSELAAVYRLHVVTIPTNVPSRRRGLPVRVFRTAAAKWAAVVARIAEMHDLGRPVLIGTRTVADSEHLSSLLAEAGLPCMVLNALQDEREAQIVSRAGRRGEITVATNMAGRGTDIKIASDVEAIGGLHVMATELHDAGRIDRQLFGRCGRQADPGTFEAFVSFEDEMLRARPARAFGVLPATLIDPATLPGRWLALRVFRRAQRAAEREHFLIRRDLLKIDEHVDTALAFSGRGE